MTPATKLCNTLNKKILVHKQSKLHSTKTIRWHMQHYWSALFISSYTM